MEPEIRAFLVRIAKSISLVLLWMLIHTLFGIRKELFFFGEKPLVWHIVYYVLFVASAIWLLWYIIRIWKQAPVYDPREDVWYYKSTDHK